MLRISASGTPRDEPPLTAEEIRLRARVAVAEQHLPLLRLFYEQ